MNPTTALWLCLGASALALLYGVITATWVLRQPAGTERMQEIAAAGDCRLSTLSGTADTW